MTLSAINAPWSSLGTDLPQGLSPTEILKASNLDWEVKKQPLMIAEETDGIFHSVRKLDSHSALIRADNDKSLGICGTRFQITQNHEAFKFFDKFCEGGQMQMHTAGSFDGGRWVWALAKVSEGFVLPGDDRVESYMLMANPHIWGEALKVMFTPIRIVCKNTLMLALKGFNSEHAFRMMHTKTFNNDEIFKQAEVALGLAKEQEETHKEQALFLASHAYKSEQDQFHYFMKVLYPKAAEAVANDNLAYTELSLKVKNLLDWVDGQPGADLKSSKGTYWGLYNALTYWADHEAGRTQSNRLKSAWFGDNAHLKRRALSVALDSARKVA